MASSFLLISKPNPFMVSSYPFVLGINSSFTFNDFLSSDLYTLIHLQGGNAAFLIRHFAG